MIVPRAKTIRLIGLAHKLACEKMVSDLIHDSSQNEPKPIGVELGRDYVRLDRFLTQKI